jgi:hypothetical protein
VLVPLEKATLEHDAKVRCVVFVFAESRSAGDWKCVRPGHGVYDAARGGMVSVGRLLEGPEEFHWTTDILLTKRFHESAHQYAAACLLLSFRASGFA